MEVVITVLILRQKVGRTTEKARERSGILEELYLKKRWRMQAEANDEVEKLLSTEIVPSQHACFRCITISYLDNDSSKLLRNILKNSRQAKLRRIMRANIASNEGNKAFTELETLKIDGTMWEARNLLENTNSKSTLLKHVAIAGGFALGITCCCVSKSKLLKYVAFVGGIALGVTCNMIFPSEKLNEFAGGLQKAGELGESMEKMTDGNKTGIFTAGAAVGIVGATFLIGLKKSSSG